MALLAEGKKKVKYGLDPQNTQWSNDDNKFGQRLMEKMGWEKGKGLGANENGMTEHIKASYKWDQRGLGATAKSADAWVAHQDDFNDLLKMLNSGNQDEPPKEKDKTTQAKDGHKRYYGRFSRGRVQTLRTTEDLDCIFGRRKSASAPGTPSNQSAANSGDEGSSQDKVKSAPNTEKSHGLTTVTSSTSVQEYFAKKMSEMKARRNNAKTVAEDLNDNSKKDEKSEVGPPVAPVYGKVGFSYSDDESRDVKQSEKLEITASPSRGWYQSWNLKQDVGGVKEESDSSRKSKKKKKDKRKRDNNDEDENSNSKRQLDFVNPRLVEEQSAITCGSKLEELEETTASSCHNSKQQKPSKKDRKKKSCKKVEKNDEIIEKSKVPSEPQLGGREVYHGVGNAEDESNLCARKAVSLDSNEKEMTAAVEEESERSFKKKKKKRKNDKELEEDVEKKTKRRKTTQETDLGNENGEEVRPAEREETVICVERRSSKKKRKNKDKKHSESPSVTSHRVDKSISHLDSIDIHEEGAEKQKEKETKVDADVCNEEMKAVEEHSDAKETFDFRKTLRNRIRRKGTSKVRSLFPGSNLEDIPGYASNKSSEGKEEVQCVSYSYKLIGGKDVDNKFREISKCQRRVPKVKKKSVSKS